MALQSIFSINRVYYIDKSHGSQYWFADSSEFERFRMIKSGMSPSVSAHMEERLLLVELLVFLYIMVEQFMAGRGLHLYFVLLHFKYN